MSTRGRIEKPQPGGERALPGLKLMAKDLDVPFIVLSQ